MRTFLLLLFASFFSFAAYAAEAKCDKCAAYASPRTSAPVAWSGKMVCVNFVQASSGNVLLTLYRADDSVAFRPDKRMFGPNGQYCFGAWRLQDVARVETCNSQNHSDRKMPSISAALAEADAQGKGNISTCLLGSAACALFAGAN